MRKYFFSILIVVLFIGFAPVQGQIARKPNPDPLRFKKAVNFFKTYDRKNSFPQKAVLFLGSSSIRKWFTHEAFPDLPVINRGFGGSHLSDVLYYYNTLLKKYKPSIVVFYEGDNDIAFGKSPQQVFNDYQIFIKRFLQDFPSAKLIFIAIKPSIARWKDWPRMQEANRLIQKFNEHYPNLFYLDLSKELLSEEGKPDAQLFAKDGLHLNEKGYARWNRKLYPLLMRLKH